MISRLPLDEQLESLRAVLSRSDVLTEVLARTATLDLPGCYVTAGRLFQTVWNVVTDRPPTRGIKDYDLSWEAEDAVIKTGQKVFADLPERSRLRVSSQVGMRAGQERRGRTASSRSGC
ncbi:nucleotidyltransferase family protein [Streptomyces sp. NPDC086077]|uniref:nucleotidyltransferase family protein n=1 Tax=Streptomyces sp. NPDC086077 TaxID=3154862 RepID=UPI00341465B6